MAHSNPHLRNMTFNETFQSSLVQKNNEKFTVQKSLIKGIKQNDVSKIIDQNQLRGGVQNGELYDEMAQLSGMVIETRKRYDERKTESLKSEQEIQKLKSQKEILLSDENKYNDMIESQRKELEETSKRLEEVTALMEATTYRKDIYANMKDVVKHDLLILKKRYFDLDVKLMRDSTKLKTLKNEHESKMKLSKRCRQMLESVEKTAQVKQLERTTRIQSFCDVLNRKQTNQQNREIRQREIEEAMISAMTDKLSEEKEWIRMLNANLFLKGLLRSKMENLMMKYSKIEISFHKMKQATSLKDSNEFIERFLNREETYGLLLESISDKEKQLEELKEERDQLQKIHSNFLYKNQEIHEEQKSKTQQKGEQGERTNVSSILQALNQQLLSISRKQQLMYQWGVRFLSAYHGYDNRDKVTNRFPKTMKKQLLTQVLKTLNKFMDDLQTQQNYSKKIQEAFLKNNPKQSIMTDDMIEKNTRIKTLSTYENEGADSFEDKDMAYDDLSEADYLQYNRRAIKKNDINRKFRIKTKPY